MRRLLSLSLMVFVAVVFLAVPSASAVTVEIDIEDMVIQPSLLTIHVDVSTIFGDGDDTATPPISGYVPTRLTADFDPSTQAATVTGIEFYDVPGKKFAIADFDLDVSIFFGAFTGFVDGRGIGGEFNTPAPPGTVSGTVFTGPQHEAIMNQGTLEYGYPGGGELIDLAPPNSETGPGTTPGDIIVGSPSIVGNQATYGVTLNLPFYYSQSTIVTGADIVLEMSGTVNAVGQFTRTLLTEVTLGLVDNGSPDTGLHRYTLTATGPGITTLSKFTIDGEVHQVFDAGSPSEWLGDGSADPLETTDSHVIFGDLRLPDLGGGTWPGPGDPPTKITEETITGGGDSGMGTLNNYDDSVAPIWDAYLKLGTPSGEETVELMQLVVADGDGFSIDLTLLTSTYYDPVTGQWIVTTHDLSWLLPTLTPGDANGDGNVNDADSIILATNWQQQAGATWAMGDFNGDGAVDGSDATILAANWGITAAGASVPEPSTLVLLTGMLLAAGLLRRK